MRTRPRKGGMVDANGWIGGIAQLEHVLASCGADRDARGRPVVRGVALFMGVGPDVVAGSEAEVRIGGEWRRIVPLMRATSYGVAVTVL